MTKKINAVLQYDATPSLQARIASLQSDWLRIDWVPESDKRGFARLMREADVLWHVLEPVTAQVIAEAPRLKLIQKIGVGVNTIDLNAALRHGVAVANMPGTNSQAVAELTLSLMLGVLRRVASFDRCTREGKGWTFDRSVLDRVGELHGRTIGMVGFGAVPRILAPVCRALGSRVVFCSPEPKPDVEWQRLDFEELLACSDIVSLHIPANERTTGLIDAAAIRRMKPGAILVNTARGALIDEVALVAALRSGHLGGAGLDVFAQEPVDSNNPLLQLDSVVLAPHIAWMTPETLERSLCVAVENGRRIRDDEPLLHRVA